MATSLWEQVDGEPNEAYARFLVYRNLGPSRSLDAAYLVHGGGAAKRGKPQQRASGQWMHDSSKFNWVERATAWDVSQLDSIVPGSVATIYKLIGEFARVTLMQIQSGKIKPRNWQQAMDAVNVLSGFITPESASAARAAMGHEAPATGTVTGCDKPE